MPAASIITPSTLSAHTLPRFPDPVEARIVPQLDFSSLNFVEDMAVRTEVFPEAEHDTPSTYFYSGPSPAVWSTTSMALAKGAILPIHPPSPNSTWSLEFSGPAIQCSLAAESRILRVRQNLASWLRASERVHLQPPQPPLYLGWYRNFHSRYGDSPKDDMPFILPEGSDALEFRVGSLSDTFSMFVASPTLADDLSQDLNFFLPDQGSLPDWLNGTLLECKVFNSSYQASFYYQHGNQRILSRNTLAEPVIPMPVFPFVLGPPFTSGGPPNLQPVKSFHCPAYKPNDEDFAPCIEQHQAPPEVSYQAVMDAFFRPLVGLTHDGHSQDADDPAIRSTVLSQLSELRKLQDHQWTLREALQEVPRATADTNTFASLMSVEQSSAISETIEELFRNVTISLMSLPSLW